jgi:hypothetical protein
MPVVQVSFTVSEDGRAEKITSSAFSQLSIEDSTPLLQSYPAIIKLLKMAASPKEDYSMHVLVPGNDSSGRYQFAGINDPCYFLKNF